MPMFLKTPSFFGSPIFVKPTPLSATITVAWSSKDWTTMAMAPVPRGANCYKKPGGPQGHQWPERSTAARARGARHAEPAAYADGITEDGIKLFQSGTWYYGGVGEHDKLAVGRYVRGRDVAQYSAGAQQSALLVEHGVQQVVGVYGAFHQHVGRSVAGQGHRLARRVVRRRLYNHIHTAGILPAEGGKLGLAFACADQHKVGKAFLQTAFHHVSCMRVGRTSHGHAFASAHPGETGQQAVEVLYRVHG